jgi:Domain of unknown function (DUF397)
VAGYQKPHLAWRKSTASGATECIEIAAVGGSVFVRDSARRDGAVLRFPPAAWSAFLALARTRERDFPPRRA